MGFIPYPKSDHADRIKQNADLYGFELSEEQMRILGMMDRGHDGAVVPQKTECP